jgi:hypothetical protein
MKSHALVASLAKSIAPRRCGTIWIVGKGFVESNPFTFRFSGGQSDTLQMYCGLVDAVWDKHHTIGEGCRRYSSHILNGRELRFTTPEPASSLTTHFLLLLADGVRSSRTKGANTEDFIHTAGVVNGVESAILYNRRLGTPNCRLIVT